MVRYFKPGDKVEPRNGGPVMEVIKYATVNGWLTGPYVSTDFVECSWFDKKERRTKTGVFHQKNLVKASITKTFLPFVGQQGKRNSARSAN